MLGPEPLSQEFNPSYFKKNAKKRKVYLKDLLMNQRFIAGLGNIYVNEALFLSKISPKVRSNKIPFKKIYLLVSNIKKVLKRAIREGGSSIKNFNNTFVSISINFNNDNCVCKMNYAMKKNKNHIWNCINWSKHSVH